MKRHLLKSVLLSVSFVFFMTSCFGSYNGGSENNNDSKPVSANFIRVNGGEVAGPVNGSLVFVENRTVTIKNLLVSDHEVTQNEYQTYCTYGAEKPNGGGGEGINYPVYNVSWYDAVIYCNLRSKAENLTPVYKLNGEDDPAKWSGVLCSSFGKYYGPLDGGSNWDSITFDTNANGYRLPTEAEWEYIARGGNNGLPATQTTYAGSNEIDSVAWYQTNSNFRSRPVKQKNPLKGIYDLSGNVSEICWDWSSSSISSSTPATGPSASQNGINKNRVCRGGNYYLEAAACEVRSRDAIKTYDRASNVGFRVVRNAD